MTEVHKDKNGKHLINNLADNVSPHFSGDDFISSADSVGIEFSIWPGLVSLERFSTDCDGTKSVHDQVNPKELDDIQWAVSKSDTTDQDNKAKADVYGELELHELADVIKDDTAPHDSMMDWKEVII